MVDITKAGSNSSIQGDVTLEHIAQRKDESVRLLEKRSFDLLCFTYSYNPDKADEINKTLEDDLDRLLLNAYKELAYHRLYGDNKSNVNAYNAQLKHLEKLTKEIEDCHERFNNAKKLNVNPKTAAIIHIFGIDDLEKRVKQSLNELEVVKKAYDNLQENCKRMLENSEHLRRMLRNLREQSQIIFYKHVQIASVIDEVASYKGVYLRDPVAEKVHKACLSQAASEFSVESWAERIKCCKESLESIKNTALTTQKNKELTNGTSILPNEKQKEFQELISKNTNLIHQLSRAVTSLKEHLDKNPLKK